MNLQLIAQVGLFMLYCLQFGQSLIVGHNSILRRYGSSSFTTTKTGVSDGTAIKLYQQKILVCGDGDLSFSAFLSNEIMRSSSANKKTTDIEFIGTVLEDRDTHKQIYKGSAENERMILHNGHTVHFGIDATDLQTHFPNQSFDRIQFNFPHWKGKANHRYNRQLIQSFFQSASAMLSSNGRIYVALTDTQGGDNCTSLQQYRDSWTPSLFAAEHGLLLYDVQPFDVTYHLSSHRGIDRGFQIGKHPKLFLYGKPTNGVPIQKQYQQCCRHELHIVLPSSNYNNKIRNDSCYSYLDIIHGNAIQTIIQTIVPDGVVVRVPARNLLQKEDTGYEYDVAVFLIVYCGESYPMKRNEADHFRHLAELEVEKYVPLRENRRGRLVSRPFPYYLLAHIIENHSNSSKSMVLSIEK